MFWRLTAPTASSGTKPAFTVPGRPAQANSKPCSRLLLPASPTRCCVLVCWCAGVLVAEAEHPYLDLAMDSPYEQLAGAAIRYVIAAGPQASRATMRLHDPLLAVGQSGARHPWFR